jgi:hypothetical protein
MGHGGKGPVRTGMAMSRYCAGLDEADAGKRCGMGKPATRRREGAFC